jgi:hypothetical protein
VANRYCRNCSHELSDDARFCPNCGRPVSPLSPYAEGTAPLSPQQPGAPAQEGRSGSRWRGPILGCLILIGLVFIAVMAAALGSGERASSPPERAERDEGVEGGGPDPGANKPLEGEKVKLQQDQQQSDQNREQQAQQ